MPEAWKLPEAAITLTKEFFVHAHLSSGTPSSHPQSGGVDTLYSMYFTLPLDFTSIDNLEVWFNDIINDASVAVDVVVNMGAIGEAMATHTEHITPNIVFVANVFNVHELTNDLVTTQGNMNAGDMVHILWKATTDADALVVWGIRVKYS